MAQKITFDIIENASSEEEKNKVCPECGCVFSYTDMKDLFWSKEIDHNVVECPDCGSLLKTSWGH